MKTYRVSNVPLALIDIWKDIIAAGRDGSYWWWLRSASDNSSNNFDDVGSGGGSLDHGANAEGGVVIGFCLSSSFHKSGRITY